MKKALLAPLCACLTSCASIINSGSEEVSIRANVPDARLTIVDGERALIYSGTTPGTLELSRKGGYFKGAQYTLTAEKEGYAPQELTLETTISLWYMGNVILPCSLVWLAIVDPLTGGMWTFEEKELSFTLQPTGAAGTPAQTPQHKPAEAPHQAPSELPVFAIEK